MHLPDGKIYYSHGVWDWGISNEHSSNYRELRNLVESLEKAAAAGLLTNTEAWLFTDNTTAKAAYFCGSSKSRQLHGLVLRLRLLEMRLGIIIGVVHVLGKTMIRVGVDGVSRGDLNANVLAGAYMLSFVPLHLSALERSEGLLPWSLSWTGENTFVLGEADWPRPHMNGGTYLWARGRWCGI
jgi:hypothetical protein